MKLLKASQILTVVASCLVATPCAVLAKGDDGCVNVRFQGVAQLGVIEVAPGIFTLGALPTPATIAGIPGLLGSIITGSVASGKGAQHFTLVHTFVSSDPARPGSFYTEDRAVAAPAGNDPDLGIINDHLTIVGGTGVFANVEGFLMNHALLNLRDMTLTSDFHGRLCSDGL